MFPEELPRRLIKMFSFVGETVLDPFAGSGTTALAAKNADRNSIGFEINPEFIPIIKEKLEVHQQDLNGTTYELDFDLGVPLSGRAFRSNLFFVPQKRISTSIPNAA
jgi:methylase of polypeptide subunit release factors